MAKYIMALDAGTTRTAVFFSTEVARCAALHRKNLHNIFQNPGG